MENASSTSVWSGRHPAALGGGGGHVTTTTTTTTTMDGGGLVTTHHLYNVGIYGWRKRCLYAFILLLMVMVIINMALLIWIIKVMDFSSNGMGKLRIVDKGLRMEGEAEFYNILRAMIVESRKEMPLKLESAQNVTLNARNREGRIINRLFIGDHKIESLARKFLIKNQHGKVLFSAADHEVEVSADSLKVTGNGGAVFDGSIQTPLVTAEAGHQLRLESPTRSLEIDAPQGIALESQAGDIAATCLTDLKLQSTDGSITMDSTMIVLKSLPEATIASNKQPVDNVFQLCACLNGRLFLAPPSEPCKADTTICK